MNPELHDDDEFIDNLCGTCGSELGENEDCHECCDAREATVTYLNRLNNLTFEQRLARLDNPVTDTDTGAILETDDYEAVKKKQMPDNLYAIYLKYVGKLDALPQNQLKLRELSNPYTGQVFPLSSWPTKTSIEKSSATWKAYNDNLRNPDGTEIEISPCADPDKFIATTMRNCMSAGQRIAKWKPRQALRRCGKQIAMLKQAVNDYCGAEGGEEYLKQLARQLAEPDSENK